jgi:hypothetical protein
MMVRTVGTGASSGVPPGPLPLETGQGDDVGFGLEAVAETLAAEFPQERSSTVIEVVTSCVAEFPDDDPMFIEQAARARLAAGGSTT